MKRTLTAAVALLAANTAFAVQLLPGDLPGDVGWKRAPEATSYVPKATRDEQPNYEFILERSQAREVEYPLP
jgi:hypothetical protein